MDNTKLKAQSEQMRASLVEQITELMETDGLNWTRSWNPSLFAPVNGASSRGYRGINRVYLALRAANAGYKDPRWMTFKQASAAGYQVKKGEHGCAVEYWKQAPAIIDPENPLKFKFLKEAEVKDYDAQVIHHVYVLAAIFKVFNFEQLEGAPAYVLPASDKTDFEIADNLIASSACPVVECASEKAYYSLDADRITLPRRDSFIDSQSFVATLIHEMSHSTGHKNRLDREEEMRGWFGSEKYAIEELRAEFSSVFTQASLGVSLEAKSIENHAAYLQSWIRAIKDDGTVLTNAINAADVISTFLLNNYVATSTTKSVA